MLAVFPSAASIIPEGPVGQQQDQKQRVKVRCRVFEERRQRPEKRAGDLGEVVEVTRDAPPAVAEKKRRAGLTAGVSVGRRYILCFLTPNHDLPVRLGHSVYGQYNGIGLFYRVRDLVCAIIMLLGRICILGAFFTVSL